MDFLNVLKNKRSCRIIRKSGLFDQGFYLNTYVDVCRSGTEPVLHYLTKGAIEGKKPNSWFDPAWYRNNYQDVRDSGMDPFLHYVSHGKNEGRFSSQDEMDAAHIVIAKDEMGLSVHEKNECFKGESAVLVSVICRTFNHEEFIEKTVNGFVNQKTNFKYEVIIGDDCSSDGTVELLEQLSKKYPEVIRLVINKKNIGPVKNLVALSELVKGKYVALCDGDDCWMDPDKLQIQVDFLENNKDYSVCFHKVAIMYEGAERHFSYYPVQCEDTTNSDVLIQNNYIQTNSVMYRWLFPGGLEKYGFNLNVMPADWYLHLLHSEKGKIKYIDRAMGIYNKHEGGMWVSAIDPLELHKKYGQKEIELFRALKQHFDGKYNDLLTRKQLSIMKLLMIDYIENMEVENLKQILKDNDDIADIALKSIGYHKGKGKLSRGIEFDLKQRIKVSVVVTSYNHRDYISKALDSVIMQEGFFEMEVIIGDDCSTDGTDEIIKQYREKYPELIRAIESDQNVGMLNNLKRCFEACTGSFIAVCEGDDYWISSSKLKKQVSYLMSNEDCSMCFNWLLLYREDKDMFVPHAEQMAHVGNKITFTELSKSPLIGNFSACVYRADAVKKVPEKYYKQKYAADWLFNMCIADTGKVGFVKELMSVYRIHNKGQWSGKSATEMQHAIKRSKNIFYEFFSAGKVDKVEGLEFSREKLEAASMLNSKEYFSKNIEKIDIVGDVLAITGWCFYDNFPNKISTSVGLLFIDPTSNKVAHGYQLPMIKRPDVKDYFLNRGVIDVPEKCGFSTTFSVSYPGDMYELALSVECDGKIVYIKIDKYLVRSLNTWLILSRKENKLLR